MGGFAHWIIHGLIPHDPRGLYVLAILISIATCGFVYGRCIYTKSQRHLERGWVIRTAAISAPLPIYFLLILYPIDQDLIAPMLQDHLVVALAGLYGIVGLFNDLRSTAGNARTVAERGGA